VLALRLMNEILRGVEGVKTGIHVCRGNWSRKEDALLKGDYEPLLPYLLSMQADQLVLEYATPRAGDMDAFGKQRKVKEIGLGVVNPRSDEVEEPESVINKVQEALKYFAPDKIYLNPDCGFGTFAERPMNTPEVSFRKLQTIATAARKLRETYA